MLTLGVFRNEMNSFTRMGDELLLLVFHLSLRQEI